MNDEIQAQFDRIDAALTTLIDSITSYNPSPSAAAHLVEADEALSASLDRLAQHQQQYATLLQLRATEEDLDARVKANLRLLADTRNDLIHRTPITLPKANTAPLDSRVLLAFAQRISKQTMPSSTVLQGLNAPLAQAAPVPHIETENEDVATQTNGVADVQMRDQDPGQRADSQAPDNTADGFTGRASEALNEQQKAYLRQDAELAFVPWPTPENIRQGALQKIQTAIENGDDPASLNSANAVDDPPKAEQADPGPSIQGAESKSQPQDIKREQPPQQLPPQATAPVQDFDEFDLYDPTQD